MPRDTRLISMHTTSTPNAARLADASGGSGTGGALRGEEDGGTPGRYALGRMMCNTGPHQTGTACTNPQGFMTALRGAAKNPRATTPFAGRNAQRPANGHASIDQ